MYLLQFFPDHILHQSMLLLILEVCTKHDDNRYDIDDDKAGNDWLVHEWDWYSIQCIICRLYGSIPKYITPAKSLDINFKWTDIIFNSRIFIAGVLAVTLRFVAHAFVENKFSRQAF